MRALGWGAIGRIGCAAATLVLTSGAGVSVLAAEQPSPQAIAAEIQARLKLPTLKAPARRNGNPDFQGAWNRYPDLLISPFLPDQPKAGDPLATPQRQMQPQLKPGPRAILDERWRRVAAAAARNEPIAERSVNCVPDGVPNMMRAAFMMEILQTADQVNISQELYNQTRRIYMKEKLPPVAELDPGYFGRSVGHFEGETFVIETTGVRDDTMAASGAPGSSGGGDVPHGPQWKIVERLRYIGPDIVQNQIVMTDPDTLEAPYTWVISYKKMPADYKFQEYVCEANRTAVDENGIQRRTDAEKPSQ